MDTGLDRTHPACEFAAAYSLGALDWPEVSAFEAHLLDGCDACEDALAGYDDVTAALAFAAEPANPESTVRSRILEAVEDAPRPRPLLAEPASEWLPAGIPGVSVRNVFVDSAARQVLMLVRAEPGSRYPAHRHTSVEEMLMLEGELDLDGRRYVAGDFIRSLPGTQHSSSETRSGCMFLLRGSLDDETLP
jgi:putative transcriptional regulator